MKRTISRIKALIILYHDDLMKNELLEEEKNEIDVLLKEGVENLEYDEKFFNEIVEGVRNNLATIDRLIAISLTKYTIDRLSYVDRALIRIGTYELKYTNTPKNIIINEIINLSHDYSEIEGFDSAKFNNALLEKISNRIENGK